MTAVSPHPSDPATPLEVQPEDPTLVGLTNELARIRQMLADHERRLYPAGPNGLPEPIRQVNQGHDMDGLQWEIGTDHSKWTVVARAEEDKEPMRCVYIHTPHSLRSSFPELHYPGDVVAMPLADAREFAASILAAVSYSENDLARRRARER